MTLFRYEIKLSKHSTVSTRESLLSFFYVILKTIKSVFCLIAYPVTLVINASTFVAASLLCCPVC